jgi:cytochrome c peroxidase
VKRRPNRSERAVQQTQSWDGRVKTLEQQAALPIVNPIEMGQRSFDAAVPAITASRNTSRLFRRSSATRQWRPPGAPLRPTTNADIFQFFV